MAAAPPAPKGLIADLQQKEVKAQEAVVSSNEEAELRTKVDNSLNTKGFSGIQKCAAARTCRWKMTVISFRQT